MGRVAGTPGTSKNNSSSRPMQARVWLARQTRQRSMAQAISSHMQQQRRSSSTCLRRSISRSRRCCSSWRRPSKQWWTRRTSITRPVLRCRTRRQSRKALPRAQAVQTTRSCPRLRKRPLNKSSLPRRSASQTHRTTLKIVSEPTVDQPYTNLVNRSTKTDRASFDDPGRGGTATSEQVKVSNMSVLKYYFPNVARQSNKIKHITQNEGGQSAGMSVSNGLVSYLSTTSSIINHNYLQVNRS